MRAAKAIGVGHRPVGPYVLELIHTGQAEYPPDTSPGRQLEDCATPGDLARLISEHELAAP